MFRTIVVPVDLTDRNRPSVEMAAKLSTPTEGTIHLLHVIETIPGLSIEEEPEFYGRLEKRATAHLEALSAPFRARGIRFEADVIYGPRAKSILEETERIGADLLVIQSHRIDGERRGEGLGTLSHQVGLFAPCPVLLVR
ncbi:MAG: universal stress protein [Vicinamibacteria bacterium]